MSGRCRGPDGTLQQRVFRVLRDVGSLDVWMIADQLGIEDRGTVSSACCYLVKRKKIARVVKRRRWVMFRALPRVTEPRDMRGVPDACRNHDYSNVLAMLHARLGMNWKPKPRGATELEKAWRRA